MHQRKIFVFASGGFQAFVALIFIAFFPKSLPLVFALGVAYGIGYGLYLRGRLGACVRHAARPRDAVAKDMGLFHIALTLPQSSCRSSPARRSTTSTRVSPNLGLPRRVRERDRAAGHRHRVREPHQVRALSAHA